MTRETKIIAITKAIQEAVPRQNCTCDIAPTAFCVECGLEPIIGIREIMLAFPAIYRLVRDINSDTTLIEYWLNDDLSTIPYNLKEDGIEHQSDPTIDLLYSLTQF